MLPNLSYIPYKAIFIWVAKSQQANFVYNFDVTFQNKGNGVYLSWCFSAFTWCVSLWWRGPVVGQRAAPVCEIPGTYLDTLRNVSGSEAINCRLTGQRSTVSETMTAKSSFSPDRHLFLCWFRTIFCLRSVGMLDGGSLSQACRSRHASLLASITSVKAELGAATLQMDK